MATSASKAGVVELTSTTGTGPYSLEGPQDGWRGFVAADDGKVFACGAYQEGGGFEEFEGAYDHNARTLSRTTILGNHLGTSDPVDWGDGLKEVSIIIAASRAVMTSAENKYLADQYFEGFRVYLDADRDSYVSMSTDDVFKLFLAAVQVLEVSGGLGNLTLIGTDDGATDGPVLLLRRDSASPAANDYLGSIAVQGRDSANTLQTGMRIRTHWSSPASGAHEAQADISVAKAGALQVLMWLIPDAIALPANVNFFTNGKSSSGMGVAGFEIINGGQVQITPAAGNTPLHVNRLDGDGNLVGFYISSVLVGAISAAAGTVTYGPFTGNHYCDWEPGDYEAFEQLGTVLACTGRLIAVTPDPVYEVRPAKNGDRRVIGVFAGRQRNAMAGEERSLIVLFAVGNGTVRVTGPAAAGDLLWASPIPGVAERQPDQDHVGPWTVAKATEESADDGSIRLVSCIYMAG